MIYRILAHSTEIHETTIETTAHEFAWYVQLPIFIVMVAIFAYLIWLLTRKKDTTLLITSLALLISGFGMFKVAPIVSATAITVGLISTLLVTLLGLGSDNTKN